MPWARVRKRSGASTKADVAVLVFARAPLPGRAKTRLVPRLGEWRAARLQARLTLRAVRTALAARCGAVELHAAPQRSSDFFLWCGNKFAVRVQSQKGRDLGERMHRAIAAGLRRHRAVILVGTDCPVLAPRDLYQAMRWLQGGCDAVLAPAEDGGYGLIGMRRPLAAAFRGIDWGSPSVYAQTLERFAHAGFRWRALRTIWDVDRPEDLERLAAMRFARMDRSRGRRTGAQGARRGA